MVEGHRRIPSRPPPEVIEGIDLAVAFIPEVIERRAAGILEELVQRRVERGILQDPQSDGAPGTGRLQPLEMPFQPLRPNDHVRRGGEVEPRLLLHHQELEGAPPHIDRRKERDPPQEPEGSLDPPPAGPEPSS